MLGFDLLKNKLFGEHQVVREEMIFTGCVLVVLTTESSREQEANSQDLVHNRHKRQK